MSDFALPVTCYAQSGELNIAYQTMGSGPVDIILIPGCISHVEFAHEMIGYTSFLRRLSAFARVVTFDKRGQGLSDRASGVAPLEQRMDDVRAIMDEIGSQRAMLFGFSEGCPMSILFAATYPERVSRIILFGGFARFVDYAGDVEERIRQRVKHWGTGARIKARIPSLAADPDAVALFAKFERLSASPGAVRAVMQMNALIDVRSILPSVRVPTLILHRQNDALVPVEQGRQLAERIPDAKIIEYPGADHAFWYGDVEAMLGDIEEFVTGAREGSANELERVLATVLFTDIVGFHAQRRQDGRPCVAAVAGQPRSIGQTDGREASGIPDQIHRRRRSRDVRRARTRGPMRAVVRGGRQADRPAPARRSAYRRDRDERPGYRRHRRARSGARHGAVPAGRSSRVKSCDRPRRWRWVEVLRTRIA